MFLLLAACATSKNDSLITTDKLSVVSPPESMYNCPSGAFYPNPDTLTDVQVAKLLVQLQRSNKTCRNSMEAIRKYLESAKATVEAQ
jgi:hypothetical protein